MSKASKRSEPESIKQDSKKAKNDNASTLASKVKEFCKVTLRAGYDQCTAYR